MDTPTSKPLNDQPFTQPTHSWQSRCPVCDGPLVELRSQARCVRCHFTICEGCGGAGAGEMDAGY